MLTTIDEPPQTMRTASSYMALVLIWSTTPLAVVLSLKSLNPIWSLTVRFLLALCLARFVLGCLRQPLPWHKQAMRWYLAGTLGLFWAMLFTYLGAQYLPSGLISLIFGLSPLLAGFTGHVILKTARLGMAQWLGMLIAIVGLGAIFGTVHMHAGMLRGMVFTLLGVISYVGSIFWLRFENQKNPNFKLHPMAQTTGSLVLSGIGLLVLLPFYWSARPQHIPDHATVFAVIYSAVFASVIAMFCYFYLVSRIKPATLSLATVITPVLALILGAQLNNEVLSTPMLQGVCVVMFGLVIYFMQDWLPRKGGLMETQ